MSKKRSPENRFSQVRIVNSRLLTDLVERSSISKKDRVVDIGAGTGQITQEVAPRARKVFAVEKDPQRARELRSRFEGERKVKVCEGDVRDMEPPRGRYKVFANPPFYLEGELIRRVITTENPPQDAFLVMRQEVAERMAGESYQSQFSILHQPDVKMDVFHRFERRDFSPPPKVRPAMLRIHRREEPNPMLETQEDRKLWEGLIRQGFGGGGDIKHNLKSIFTYRQLRRISSDAEFKLDDNPTDLSFDQWAHIFHVLKDVVAPHQRDEAKKLYEEWKRI